MSDKPDFDPNQPFEVQGKPAFNPNQPYEEVKTPDETPIAASASAGFFKGLPFASQIGAAGKTGMDVLTGVTSPSDAVDEYRNQRDTLKNDLDSTAKAHPYASAAGGLASAAMMPLSATPEAMGAYGAASGLSESKADLTKGEFDQAATDTERGGALGALLSGATEELSPYAAAAYNKFAQPVADYLKQKAGVLALQATKIPGVTAYNKLRDGAGNWLLDHGIVGFGDTQAGIANKATDMLSGEGGIGPQLGGVKQSLSDAGASVDRKEVLKALDSKIDELSQNEANADLVRVLKRKREDIQSLIPEPTTEQTGFYPSGQPIETVPPKFSNDDYFSDPTTLKPARWINGSTEDQWAKMRGAEVEPGVSYTPISPKYSEVPGDSTIPLTKSEDIKGAYDTSVPYNSTNTDKIEGNANKVLRDIYNNLGENAAQQTDQALGDQFLDLKDQYGMLKPIARETEKKASVYSQGPSFNLHALRPGAIGAAVGGEEGYRNAGIPGALAGAAAGALIGPRVLSSAASGTNFLSDIVKSAPQSLGKWAPTLTAAVARGGTALGATDYLLQSTDPEYRQHIQMLKNSQDNQNRSVANEGN
ncbi:MAG: hypothetical protein NVS3B3_05940 [Aquirhabdus sp.]